MCKFNVMIGVLKKLKKEEKNEEKETKSNEI